MKIRLHLFDFYTICQKTFSKSMISHFYLLLFYSLFIFLTLLLCGCQREVHTENPPPQNPSFNDHQIDNTLTIYTSQSKKSLQPLLDQFTQTTGIAVSLHQDPPLSLLARLKVEGNHSPADVLLSQDVGIFWQASEQGMLQPFNSDKTDRQMPEKFRNQHGDWLALSYYGRTLVFNHKKVAPSDVNSYADLAKPKWFRRLCLTDGKLVTNQSLVVNLMDVFGEHKTSQILQGWVTNLAIPTLPDDESLLAAIESEKCHIGIVNSDVYGRYLEKNPKSHVKLGWVAQGFGGVHTNINAAAILKTAKHPEYALLFIEWLAEKQQQPIYASLSKTFPISEQAETSAMLKAWGDFSTTNIPIHQYGEGQKAAIELMKEMGYY